MSMTEQERLAWEQEQGFISFVTTSNEVYERIAEKELSIEQLKEEMLSLSEYLVLEQEESGNYVLLHALESTPKRFLVNKNRILQIGNTLYKVFEHNVVMADVQHRSTLESLTEKTYRNAISDEIQLMICEDELKDDAYNVSLNPIYIIGDDERYLLERRNDNGSYRTRIRVGMDFLVRFIPNSGGQWYTFPILWGEVQPYRRIAGIWYINERTISCEFNIYYDYKENNIWMRSSKLFYSNSGTQRNNLYIPFQNFSSELNLVPRHYFNNFHIAALQCWAKTEKTGQAKIEHNIFLFN